MFGLTWILGCGWALSASAGELVIDAKIATQVAVDGVLVADLLQAGVLRTPIADGLHEVKVVSGGHTSTVSVTAKADVPVVVVAGRSGVTLGAPSATTSVAATGPAAVEVRAVGAERVLLQVAGQRVLVTPGTSKAVQLAAGEHPVVVRSSDGTMVYARGVLSVGAGDGLVLQIGEGAMPETAGSGLRFIPEGR